MTIRYRKLDANGDYVFGHVVSYQEFWIDQQEAIQQSILTRLKLITGEWFLDFDAGTPYETEVLGYVPPNVRDFAIRARILDTVGVNSITTYNATVGPDRVCTLTAEVDTIYGNVAINTTF